MLLSIRHRTEYSYDSPPAYGVMRLRVAPRSLGPQRVVNWKIDVEGAEHQVSYRDLMGNETWLISMSGAGSSVVVTAEGRVETQDSAGIWGPHRRLTPLWLFARPTPLTEPGDGIAALVDELGGPGEPGSVRNELELSHRLMNAVADRIVYDTTNTDPTTTAEGALARGTGVCQDHTHVMVSAARKLGLPARYVSGYLRLDGQDEQTATHAWAELHLDGLGWVGFDASNRISPDERYVRIASGRDYEEAAPVGGVHFGSNAERLDVSLFVGQSSQQQ